VALAGSVRGQLKGRTLVAPVVVVSALIALVLLLPLGLLALEASGAGASEIERVLLRERSLVLLVHTVALALLVTFAAALLGVAGAWCTERTMLAGRRTWTVLLVLPVAIPDFVAGYAWHSIAPTMDSLAAATLIMTLGTYPLVYLPVAAALRRTDPAMEESAQSLGIGQLATFVRVTLPLIRTAILGGCVLVALAVISEYGAFEIVRYQTFTTEIFTEFQFDPPAAAALSIPLALLGVLVLAIDGALVGRARTDRVAPRRASPTVRLRRSNPLILVALGSMVVLGVGVPIGTLVYWMARGQHTTLPAAATLVSATWATVSYSALAAGVAVVLALPVALMRFRRSSRPRVVLERSTYLTQALPGVIIALGLVFFATHDAYPLYHTGALLIAGYVILHFSLAFVCVKTSVTQAPARLVDVGRSLGRGRLVVFVRITLPLLLPGLAAGFCLVFLTAVTELTATLVLAPIGVYTLATQFWAYQSEAAYGAAAPYALMIVLLAAAPGALLVLWFDRQRQAPDLLS
jgi:iron(III) transport system permease protein